MEEKRHGEEKACRRKGTDIYIYMKRCREKWSGEKAWGEMSREEKA